MDRDWLRRQTALRARADEAIRSALAAADACLPARDVVVSDAMQAINLACWDEALDAVDRLALSQDALLIMAPLKKLAEAPPDARPALMAEVFRRTHGLLLSYAERVRAGRTPS